MTDPEVASARSAVISYARDTAKLASFPLEPWLERALEQHDGSPPSAATLKLVTTDKLRGRVLPRPDETWVAMLPFGDLTKKMPVDAKAGLVQKRRCFLDLLVQLALSRRFCWGSNDMHCGESRAAETETASSAQSFWVDLFRSLCQESALDSTKDLERNLVVLASERIPQFLLCVASEVSSGDTLDLLEQFLSPVDKPDGAYKKALALCGLDALIHDTAVDVALSFSKGRISPDFISKLYEIVDRCTSLKGSSCIRLRVTSLRFGQECSFSAKTLEMLGKRQAQSPIVNVIRLGTVLERKLLPMRDSLTGLLGSSSGLKRFTISSHEDFSLVASVLRTGQSSLEELDVKYETTAENAAWLAFSLFHVDSGSRVSTLRLRVPSPPSFGGCNPYPDEEWFTTFKRVLGSVTADQDLADMEGDSEDSDPVSTRRFAKIKAKTQLKSGPYSSARQICRLDGAAEDFEVLAEVDSFIAVVVPGIGVGWASSQSVDSERTAPSRLGGQQGAILVNGRIKSLSWETPGDLCDFWTKHHSIQWLLELLDMIGEPLTSLHLPVMKLQTEHLAQILRRCPHLKELNVSGHEFVSIQPLVDAYASGRCRIESLSLEPRVRSFQETTIREMTDILEGPASSILRRLVVHLHPSTFREMRYLDEEVLPLCQNISTSKTLEYVQLPGSKHWEDRMAAALRTFPPEESARRPELPLGLASRLTRTVPMKNRNKLAFLSVLEKTSTLDSAVVAQIFSFAANAVVRRIIKDSPLALDRCFCKTCAGVSVSAHLHPRNTW